MINLVSTAWDGNSPYVHEISPDKDTIFPSIHLPHLRPGFRVVLGLRLGKRPHPAIRASCDFCSSDRRFALGFFQIPPHGGHPCLRLYPSHRADWGFSPVRTCAHRAHKQGALFPFPESGAPMKPHKSTTLLILFFAFKH